VFAEQARDADNQTEAGAQMMTMVRSMSWKLVHYLSSEQGELYDLTADPGERRNLWTDPAAAAQKRELLDALRDWRISSSLRTRGWTQPWR
jgi:arylsulfatase A-like enzyme